MRKAIPLALFATLIAAAYFHGADTAKTSPNWALNVTNIEACTCPMFCQCYFDTKPAAHTGHGSHGEGRYCRFNMAQKVNSGHFGKVNLAGVKFWVSGDLGEEFGDGDTDWAIVTFDPAVTKEQRDAIASILGHLYPVKWKNFSVASDAPLSWTATPERAEAQLDGGKAAQIILHRNAGMTHAPTVMTNLRYFGAPRNNGFVMMPNEIQTYKLGQNYFESKGTTGFMITYDISSKDVKSTKGM
jgi:hypothetical protein